MDPSDAPDQEPIHDVEHLPDAGAAHDTEALIAAYFVAEQAHERDAVFDALARTQDKEATAFFVAMMGQDDDIFMRIAAAGELLGQGFEHARAFLHETLDGAADDDVFEEAIAALERRPSPDSFNALLHIMNDATRDRFERRLAMVGMERLAPAEAMSAFVAMLEACLKDPDSIAEDRLEVALAGLMRQSWQKAAPVIETLTTKLMQHSYASDDETHQDVIDMLQEASAVLDT